MCTIEGITGTIAATDTTLHIVSTCCSHLCQVISQVLQRATGICCSHINSNNQSSPWSQERRQSLFLFFFNPSIILALLFSRSLPVVTQIRGLTLGPPPPSPALLPPPHYVRYVPSFNREKNSAFSSLVDSHRIVPTHAAINRRCQQVILFFYFC